MTNKFAVFNPNDGTYTMTSSEQERDAIMAQMAWNTYLCHTNNSPFSNVSITPEGAEQWSAANGTPQLSPKELESQMAEWLSSIK